MEDNVRPNAKTVRERRASDHFSETVTFAGEVVEPTPVSKALSGPNAEQWREAMQQEFDSLQDYGVWELTEMAGGRRK